MLQYESPKDKDNHLPGLSITITPKKISFISIIPSKAPSTLKWPPNVLLTRFLSNLESSQDS